MTAPPSVREDRARRLDAVLTRHFGLAAADIHPDLSAEEVGRWDSLAHAALILEVERAFGIIFGGIGSEGLTSRRRLLDAIDAALDGRAAFSIRPATLPPQTDHADPIVVLGDSQVRAFAYSPDFLPILLLRGLHLNTLTPANEEKTAQALAWVMERLPARARIVFASCGTTTHHAVDTFGTRTAVPDADAPAFLAAAARRLIKRLKTACAGRPLLVLTSPLNRDPDLCFFTNAYNDALMEAGQACGVPVLDQNIHLTGSDGLAQAGWLLDPYHVSSAFARRLIPEMAALGFARNASDAPVSRRYAYRIGTALGTVSVWGECPEDALRLPTGEDEFGHPNSPVEVAAKHIWERYHPRTDRALQMVAALDRYAAVLLGGGPWSTCVLDCAEGLVPFLLDPARFDPVTGRDPAPWRIANARLLAALHERHGVLFEVARTTEPPPPCDVIVLFERETGTGDFLSAIFRNARAAGRLLAIVSDEPTAAAALLRQCGFAFAAQVPVGPLHRMSGPAHRHPMMIGLTEGTPALVLATADPIASETLERFRAAVEEDLAAQAEWLDAAGAAYGDTLRRTFAP